MPRKNLGMSIRRGSETGKLVTEDDGTLVRDRKCEYILVYWKSGIHEWVKEAELVHI